MNKGILVISHGSRNAKWNRLVNEAVAQVNVPDGVPIESSFLELVEGSLIQDGIDRLVDQGVTDLLVVPLFVSSGSTHIDEISWALGVKPEPELETDLERFVIPEGVTVHWGHPMDDEPEVAGILLQNIRALSQNPHSEKVLIIAHGSKEPGFHERWQRGLDSLAARLKALGGFAAADTAMLLPDQVRTKLADHAKEHPDQPVIAAPLFLSEGYFTQTVIPERMDGFDVRYNGKALLPNPLIVEWMEKQAAHLMEQVMAWRQSDGLA